MDKLQHLKTCKTFLRKVVAYRRNLSRMNAGKPINGDMAATMKQIDYWVPRIGSFDEMLNWLVNPDFKSSIIELIPVNKCSWIEELESLIEQGCMLKHNKQTQPAL